MQGVQGKTMNLTKKLIVVLMAVISVMLVGCSYIRPGDNGKINIVTTVFASYDFAKQVAGDNANVTLLIKPGSESHSSEPTPKDIIAMEECDIFIYTGGENDTWLDYILESVDNKDMVIIKMLDLVEKYEEEHVEGMEGHHHHHSHDHEDHEGEEGKTEWDEHVWTDPLNAVKISEKIKDVLCEEDSSNKVEYERNFTAFSRALIELDMEFEEIINNAERKEIVFGDRFPLRYFVEAYGLDYYAAFPGCAAESEPSAKTVAFLIDKVKENGIPVVFKIELSNGNIAETIGRDAGAKVLTFYTCHNLSRDDFENGETYISLMERNLLTLREALI